MTEIAVVPMGDAAIVCMPRRVDVTNAQDFVDAVRQELAPLLVLDFSSTEAIDSTALGAIVQVFKALRSEERELRLASVSDAVRRVFAITRLDRVFDIFDTAEAAARAGSHAN
jgi:anti-sigma B factor antagonist